MLQLRGRNYQLMKNILRDRIPLIKLMAVKVATYPFIGFSTLLACKIVREKYTLEEFNLFVLMWGSIGLIGIVEYSLGIRLTNHLVIKGFDKKFIKKLKATTTILILPFFLFLAVAFISKTLNINNEFKITMPNLKIGVNDLVINVALSTIFITSYNLVTRISNGIDRFSQSLTTLALGNVLVVVVLLLSKNFSFPMLVYLVILASAYLFSAIFQVANLEFRKNLRNHSISVLENKFDSGFTDMRYSIVVISISIMVSFINFYPRWRFAVYGNSLEVSGYLTALLVLGVFNSVSASISPMLWNTGIKRNSRGFVQFPVSDYRLILAMNIFLAIPFIFSFIFLMNYYDVQIIEKKILLIGFLSFLYLFLQNLHLIASNYLNNIRDLKLQFGLLVCQAIALLFCIEILDFQTASSIFVLQILVALLLSISPSIYVLWKKSYA